MSERLSREQIEVRITADMNRAFRLGETYGMQANSDSFTQHRRADVTKAQFNELLGATVSAISSPPTMALASLSEAEPVAWIVEGEGLTDNDRLVRNFQESGHGDMITPLYTSPPPAPEGVRLLRECHAVIGEYRGLLADTVREKVTPNKQKLDSLLKELEHEIS